MPDEEKTAAEKAAAEKAEADKVAAEAAAEAAKKDEGKAPGSTPNQEMFPASYVKELRDESAGLRVKLREVEEKLASAKSQEDIDAALSELSAQNEQLRREVIAGRHKLPPQMAARLAGKTDEELEADAQELARLVRLDGDDDDTFSGGLNPKGRGGVVTAEALVERARKSRRPF